MTDPQVMNFWNDEYPKMNYKGAFDGVAPIANKLGAFLSNPIVRKALCDPEQPVRLRQVMDSGTPLVVNLAKGRLGSDVADVLGGLMLSLMAQAAYIRVAMRPFERRPFITYADEFHNFTTESTASMLSELRKFKVGLVLAGQYTSQIERPVLDAILGNVGTLMCFRIGAQDAALHLASVWQHRTRPFCRLAQLSDVCAPDDRRRTNRCVFGTDHGLAAIRLIYEIRPEGAWQAEKFQPVMRLPHCISCDG